MPDKKKKTKAERAYKEMKSYVNNKIKLFGNYKGYGERDKLRTSHMLEILEEMKRIMDRA